MCYKNIRIVSKNNKFYIQVKKFYGWSYIRRKNDSLVYLPISIVLGLTVLLISSTIMAYISYKFINIDIITSLLPIIIMSIFIIDKILPQKLSFHKLETTKSFIYDIKKSK